MASFATYCTIYSLNPASGAPRATHVPCFLAEAYQCGCYETTPILRPFTHTMEVDLSVDIRDSYPGQAGSWLLGNTDTVVFEDPAGVAMIVIFVSDFVNAENERVQKVYLDRLHPSWPIVR